MKILAFSDLHRDIEAATSLLEASSHADVLVGAGDFATRGKGTLETLEVLAKSDVPVILVHGNHDDAAELAEFCTLSDSLHYLHGTSATIDGTIFFGLGGEIPQRNTLPWNASETEEHAAQMLEKCPRKTVLITHTPPYGIVDQQKNGKHEGSAAIYDAIFNLSPQLLLCGHIHEAWGCSGQVETTYIHNLGPTLNWFEI